MLSHGQQLNDEQKLNSGEIQHQFEDRIVLIAMDKRPKHGDAFIMVPEAHFQIAVDSIKDETKVTLTMKYEAYRPNPAPSPGSVAAGSTDKHSTWINRFRVTVEQFSIPSFCKEIPKLTRQGRHQSRLSFLSRTCVSTLYSCQGFEALMPRARSPTRKWQVSWVSKREA